MLYTALAVFGVIGIYRFTLPVLFHWPGECVCTDYSPEVEGFTIWNPLRNHAPERAAERFLEDYSDGKESAFAEPGLAKTMTHEGSRIRWKLKDREDKRDVVLLFYSLDDTGTALVDYEGEGMITMKKVRRNWKADEFNAVW
jgi:hypothetical protein